MTRPKTGAFLGRITENGFVPPPKHQPRQALHHPFEEKPEEQGLRPLLFPEERLTVIDSRPYFVPRALR
jgi:hypothetical protein